VSQYQKDETNLDLLEQEIVSGNVIAGLYANLHHPQIHDTYRPMMHCVTVGISDHLHDTLSSLL